MQAARGPVASVTGPSEGLPISLHQGPGRDEGSRCLPCGLFGNREGRKESTGSGDRRVAPLGNKSRSSKASPPGTIGKTWTSNCP
eukprot:8538547-Heterocapsa_arctica.AAC.1